MFHVRLVPAFIPVVCDVCGNVVVRLHKILAMCIYLAMRYSDRERIKRRVT